MKKLRIAMAVGLSLVMLVSCGQEESDGADDVSMEMVAEISSMEIEVSETKEKFNIFEEGLSSINKSYEKIQMAAEYIGAEEGYKYKLDDVDIELYKFDIESESYKSAFEKNAVTIDGFGDFAALFNGEMALVCDSENSVIIDLFQSI